MTNPHNEPIPDSELPDSIPAPILYAHRIFNVLCSRATKQMVHLPLQDEPQEAWIFEGSLTDVYDESGASKGYYSEIRELLTANQSIIMLERGTTRGPSKILVQPTHSPPLEYSKGGANVKSRLPLTEIASKLLTVEAEAATLRESIEVLAARLGGLNIAKALENHESRISRLEAQNGKNGERQDSQDTAGTNERQQDKPSK